MKLVLSIPIMVGVLISYIPQATGKDMPSINTNAYIARFQVIIDDTDQTGKAKKYTTYATESYDWGQQKSSLAVAIKDQITTIFMDYKDQEIVITNVPVGSKLASACSIVSMKKAMKNKAMNDHFHFFGGFSTSTRGGAKMFSSKEMFSLNTTFNHEGFETIDGIEAEKWSAQMQWTDDNDSFKITYYFTSDEWVDGEGTQYMYLPLRVTLKGTKTYSNGATGKLNHIYEYLSFETSKKLRDDAFDIPSGINCISIDENPLRDLPTMPTEVEYEIETIDSSHSVVKVTSVAYSKALGLLNLYTPTSQITYDFNHGVRYEQVTESFECNIRAIDPNYDNNAKLVNNYAQDIGPAELASFNNKYTYDGKGHTRNIATTVYGGDYKNNPYSVQFAAKDWHFSPYSYQRPIAAIMNKTNYNFFNFRTNVGPIQLSNIESCLYMYKEVVISFMVTPAVYYNGPGGIDGQHVLKALSTAIANVAGIKASQVSINSRHVHYYQDRRILRVELNLVDQPPAEYKYRVTKNHVAQTSGAVKSQKVTVTSDSSESAISMAASRCEYKYSSGDIKCRSFDLCKNSDGSYYATLYEASTSGAKLAQSINCDNFQRSVDTTPSVSSDQAVQNLKNDVLKYGKLVVTVLIKDKYYTRNITLTATSVKAGYEIYANTEWDHHHPMQSFMNSELGTLAHKTLIPSVKSLTGCAQKCLDMGWDECQNFQYCSTKICYISTDTVNQNKTTDYDFSCSIYSRAFMNLFKLINGKTMPYKGTGEKMLSNVKESGDCAKACVQTNDINCESFDYCYDTNECLLRSTHIYAATADQITNSSEECLHFSKNYILDFKLARKTALSASDGPLVKVQAKGAEQCAYICRTGANNAGCMEFDYCADTQTCQIAGGSHHSGHAHVASASCDTYSLKDGEKLFHPGASAITSQQAKSYSKGSFAGLAVGMIILGVLFGAALFYVLYDKKILNKVVS